MLDEAGNVVPEWMVVLGKISFALVYAGCACLGVYAIYAYSRAVYRMVVNGEGTLDALTKPSKAKPIAKRESIMPKPVEPVSMNA